MTSDADDQNPEPQAGGTAREYADLLTCAVGEPIVIANEFSEVRLMRVETRNGARLMLEAPKSGQWVTLCPLELESLTWQNPATFSAMVGHPFAPLFDEDEATGADPAEERHG